MATRANLQAVLWRVTEEVLHLALEEEQAVNQDLATGVKEEMGNSYLIQGCLAE